jgi:PTH1 family peptidyl-tRNA hydrolase
MKLIIGLGNPGKKYEKTRHNAGFFVINKILDKKLKTNKTKWKENKKAKALYYKTEINGIEAEFLKPTTFMNNSGVAVAFAVKKYPKLKPEDIIVAHDDKDIPLGEMRIQTNRGPAGHNGVKSIIEHLGTQNFTRARIGVAPIDGNNIGDTADFVLKKFTKEEQNLLNKTIAKVADEIIKMIN